jgi:hypothetical protein
MGILTTDGVFYRVDGERIETGMTIRRYDDIAAKWFEGIVSNVSSYDHEQQSRNTHLSLAVQGYAPSPLVLGQQVEIVSKAELYNREMDERNRIILENREKPWLPFHDGE